MLRVAFFGSGGDFSHGVLREVARDHRVVALIRARRPTPAAHDSQPGIKRKIATLLRLPRDPVAEFARRLDAPLFEATGPNPEEVSGLLRQVKPDLICIAAFPWLLPPDVYTIPHAGAINLHSSLLPRHRGVLPLFWIYYHDDRETGVTVHRVDSGADTGDILAQDRYPLPRGCAVDSLNHINARRGAALMRRVLACMQAGTARSQPQEHERATLAPRIRTGMAMVDFERWDAERVWHFLAGLQRRFREPLHDASGHAVQYDRVLGYELASHTSHPGTVETNGRTHHLYCMGGFVKLASASSRWARVAR